MIRTGPGGRFRFALKMSRSADYRLVWHDEANHPEGVAAFGIDVHPAGHLPPRVEPGGPQVGPAGQGQHLPQAPRP